MPIQDSHKNEFDTQPLFTVKVPDVATIYGEFAHYCKGRVLCCTNSYSLQVSISESEDNQVRMLNTLTGDKKRFSVTSLKLRKEDKWANYVKGVYYHLGELGIHPKAYNFTFDGQSLKNDNASLAGAISVGVCLALRQAMGFDLDEQSIAMLCYRSCTSYCAETTKYSTIVASLLAVENKFMLLDLNTFSYKYVDNPFDDENCSILVVDCRIPPLAMREEIAHRHMQVKQAFLALKAASSNISMKDFPLSDLVDRVIQIGEEDRKICAAVLEACSKAASAEKLFATRNYPQIGKDFTRIGMHIRDDLDLSCPEIDWIIKRSQEIPGCYGATMVFGGDNTYVVLAIAPSAIEKFNARFDDYERIFGFKAKSTTFRPCGRWELLTN